MASNVHPTTPENKVVPLRPKFMEGIDPNVDAHHGLVGCAALLAEIAAIRKNMETIKESGAAALERIAAKEREVRSLEVAQLLDEGDGQESKRKLARAVAELTGLKEVNRELLSKLETAQSAIDEREERLPRLRSEERAVLLSKARTALIPTIPAAEVAARNALIELVALKAIEFGCSPGAIDLAKVAARLGVEHPINETAWNRFIELTGVQPM